MQRPILLSALVLLAGCGSDKSVEPKPVIKSSYTLAMHLACAGNPSMTMAVGDVRAVTSTELASLCLASGSGSEYVLSPVLTGADSSKSVTFDFTSTGTSAPTNLLARIPNAASLSASDALLQAPAASSRAARFDARLREDERALFAERATAARAAYDARRTRSGALFSSAASAPTVGTLVSLNANSSSACSSPDMRTGRVVAVTTNAVVIADTVNPANGFTDAEYASIGADFDTLAYAVDTLNFGKPADIDLNGDRVVIFFTKAVNDLTPANSDSYVGGFFYGRDLYPKTTSGGLQGCAGSNYGELFYTLVPDSVRAGSNTSSPFTKARVKQLTAAVLAHEFQHLINLSRRLYVTRTSVDEATFLNEGLSHVAEELVFYRAAGLQSRQNLTLAALQGGGAKSINAFNEFESSNMGRLLEYLPATETNSPIADNDSLETRGATWQLLRYAADRKGGNERDTWYALVNSTTRGLPNLQNVFGAAAFGGTRPWLRDWAVANYTDDAGFAVASTYQHLSWNFRNLLPALTKNAPYPLKVRALTEGSTVSLKLLGGGGAGYLKFRVGTVATTAPAATTNEAPAGLDLMLVRTK